jgi:hypothetical protein
MVIENPALGIALLGTIVPFDDWWSRYSAPCA